ncbi:MAG: type 4a pilus biogenesis protein PilO [Deltaproteobacteria bacterium]
MNGDFLKQLAAVDLAWISRLKKELIGLSLLVVISFFFYSYAYQWTVNASNAASRQIQSARMEMKRIQGEIDAAEELKKTVAEASVNLKQIEARLQEMKERLPSDKHISRILAEVSENGFKRNVHIVSIKPVAFEDKGELLRLPFQITMEADFKSFGDYLERIENLQRVMMVDNFKIEKKEGAAMIVAGEVYLSAYVLDHGK